MSRAFFEMDRRCAAFENGISKSFNRAILIPRHKPIITMLEEIRLCIMQRLAAMNKRMDCLSKWLLRVGNQERRSQLWVISNKVVMYKCRMWELRWCALCNMLWQPTPVTVGKDLDLVVEVQEMVNKAAGCGGHKVLSGVEEEVEGWLEQLAVVDRRGGGRGSRVVGSTRWLVDGCWVKCWAYYCLKRNIKCEREKRHLGNVCKKLATENKQKIDVFVNMKVRKRKEEKNQKGRKWIY
ncbi:hypothetical protein Tco_1363355 [Tanacetum coccineum]